MVLRALIVASYPPLLNVSDAGRRGHWHPEKLWIWSCNSEHPRFLSTIAEERWAPNSSQLDIMGLLDAQKR